MSPSPAIGIIGGSGLYDLAGLEAAESVTVNTPFGRPSAPLQMGEIAGRRVAFLARHGKGHRVDPSHINYRANIYALKAVGVRKILSVSAVGSMKEGLAPGQIVLADQFIDRTRQRKASFFGDGCVAHIGFADPICKELNERLGRSATELGLPFQPRGTYVCMEGPAFSTRAESHTYRGWGVDIIGMTNLTEAKLAREAELCYATIAMVTDYDCWHEAEEDVTVEAVLQILRDNVAKAGRLLKSTISELDPAADCPCHHALEGALMSAPNEVVPEVRERLALLLAPYEAYAATSTEKR
jgi:5'-methylthioadenosine phosphorylase